MNKLLAVPLIALSTFLAFKADGQTKTNKNQKSSPVLDKIIEQNLHHSKGLKQIVAQDKEWAMFMGGSAHNDQSVEYTIRVKGDNKIKNNQVDLEEINYAEIDYFHTSVSGELETSTFVIEKQDGQFHLFSAALKEGETEEKENFNITHIEAVKKDEIGEFSTFKSTMENIRKNLAEQKVLPALQKSNSPSVKL